MNDDNIVHPEERMYETLFQLRKQRKPDVPAQFEALDISRLSRLPDRQKLAVWLNAYNVGIQSLLEDDSTETLPKSFFDSAFLLDEVELSLNDIEHGILRKHQGFKLDYNPTAPTTVLTKLEVDSIEPRIHFALNCGAQSCPPVRLYESNRIDEQLEAATVNYLESEVNYDSSESTVILPELFAWFESDFGGKQNMIQFLQSRDTIPNGSNPTIKYKDWNWKTVPRNFMESG